MCECILSRQLPLYNTMIYSYLSDCTIVWGSTSHITLHSLIILQKRAFRFVTNSWYRAHTSSLFKLLRVLSLLDIYKSQIIFYMYKVRYRIYSSHCSWFFRQMVSSPRYRYRMLLFFTYPLIALVWVNTVSVMLDLPCGMALSFKCNLQIPLQFFVRYCRKTL